MTISIIRCGVILLLCGGLIISSATYAEDGPHWSKTGCQDCHVEAAPVDGVVNLQASDAEKLCESCHGGRGDARACRHLSGLPVGDMDVAEGLASALKDGEVVCSTCHDIVYQCQHARVEYSFQNPGFLRDRKSRETGDYCIKCHTEAAYERLNPHQGVAGNSAKATCPLCHVSIPQSDSKGSIQVSFNMQHSLNDTCNGCHDVRPHPRKMFSYSKQEEDAWVHLVKPTEDVLAIMRQSEASTGIALPLDPMTGEIYCATCHSPHEFKGGPIAEQPKHRLRVNNICESCHEK